MEIAKEYIEREALLKDISESVVFTVRGNSPSLEIRGANKVIDSIKSAPTADVVEVKRSKWVVEAYDDDNRMLIIPYIKHQHSEPFCLHCGKRALLNGAEDYVTSNYCPYCGAKMDLKEGTEG